MSNKQIAFWGLGIIIALGGCLLFVLAGGGFIWLTSSLPGSDAIPTAPVARSTPLPTFTPTPIPSATSTPTPTVTPSPTLTPTETPLPTDTPTLVVPSSTPTETPLPPTATTIPTIAPTSTPLPPTATPTPSFSFTVLETSQYPTNHLNFDVYVAVTDPNNKPLPGYRIIGTHSSGLVVEGQESANDWTANSGAMHYKGGNIKYEAFNSPTGSWHLQLVDSGGNPVAPALDFAFDATNPSWYFVLYRMVN